MHLLVLTTLRVRPMWFFIKSSMSVPRHVWACCYIATRYRDMHQWWSILVPKPLQKLKNTIITKTSFGYLDIICW